MKQSTSASFLLFSLATMLSGANAIDSDGCFETTQELYDAVDEWLTITVNDDFVHPQGHISDWCTSRISDFSRVFHLGRNSNANRFNAALNWDVSSATDMTKMFMNADNFDGDGLENWDVSKVTSFEQTFRGSRDFNGDLSNWNVGSATSMEDMFRWAPNFSGTGIGSWDVSGVRTFEEMFIYAGSFEADLGAWDVSSATTIQKMFLSAVSFTGQGVDQWTFGSDMGNMANAFKRAEKFDVDLCSSWGSQLDDTVSMSGIFADTACDDTSNPVFDVSAGSGFDSFCGTCTRRRGLRAKA